MQLMLGVLKKKLKHDLKHDVEELDLPQATTASRILKDRSPDVTLLREEGLRTMAEEIGVPSLTLQFEKAPTRAGSREGGPSIPALAVSGSDTRLGRRCRYSRAFTSYAERLEKEKYCFARTTHQKWPGTAQKTGIETRCGREGPFRSRQRRFRWCEYAPHGRGRTLKSCRRQSFRFSRTR